MVKVALRALVVPLRVFRSVVEFLLVLASAKWNLGNAFSAIAAATEGCFDLRAIF